MTRFEGFLDEIDVRWSAELPDRLVFRAIGSTALFLQTGYERGTKDGDVLRAERDGFGEAVCAKLERLAGRHSALAERHRMYLDLVSASLPFLPERPTWHPYPGGWRHIELVVLDVAAVCVSKLTRWVGSDREDVSQMIHRGALEHPGFVSCFRSVVSRHAFDGRAEEALPRMLRRFHEVERDLFVVAETDVELPGWLDG